MSGRESVILFRKDIDTEEEFKACDRELLTVENRGAVESSSLVIGRYSVLPYYKELEKDLAEKNSVLINSHEQHNFISNISEWYPLLKEYTFQTWFSAEELPMNQLGSFVVKGNINSRKHSWDSKMFAMDRGDVGRVIANLMDDPLVSPQGFVIRQFHPLQTYMFGINGLPITNEHRIFVLNGQFVDYGYYWGSHAIDIVERLGKLPEIDNDGWRLATTIKRLIGDKCNFYCIDIGKTSRDQWYLIELGDAQQCGLGCITPASFYRNLQKVIYGH